ncbi:MAG TPA: glutaminyl-peptide cyclotransferase [Sphingobacteriaceae bacterium]
MKRLFFTLTTVIITASWSCTPDKPKEHVSFLTPEIGSSVHAGEPIPVKLDFGSTAFDSVVYYVDSTVIGRKTDTSGITLKTAELPMGNRLFTAKVYQAGNAEDVTSNVILLAGKQPEQFGYQVVKTFPHDTSSYTQGLEYHDGIFYESDGVRGESSLRKVEVATGKVLQQTDMPDHIFAEGITVVGDKVIQITYQEHVFLIYDRNTLEKTGQLPYPPSREGWGLAFDGTHILNTDGTNVIHFLNKDNFLEEKYLEVYDNNGPVDQLNELEVIDGKIYANIYTSNKIVIIDPANGAVTGEIDLSGIYPEATDDLVLNGIAFDKKGDRLFVTGKKWDKLFQIRLVKK